MRIFVTGATGFIGSRLALRLAEEGHTVHALFRSPQKAVLIQHKNIQAFKGDVLDKLSLKRAMISCEQCYHLGAFTRVWDKDPDIYHRVNVLGTMNVVEMAFGSGIHKVVVTSTAGVLGPSDGEPVDERTERVSPFFSRYESSKYEMEKRVREYVQRGHAVVVVNPTRVYGPGLLSETNSLTKIIKAYFQGRWHIIPGKGDTIGNYAFVDDVVNGHILAMAKGKPGERYILGGVNKSYNDFFDLLSKVCEKKFWMIRFPVPLMLGAAGLRFAVARLFRRPPLIPPQWVKRYLQDWAVSSGKAERELGYKITPMEKGLRITLNWLRKGLEQ
ncbi:MAG: NAD-dependent epimerase/dehydratase family protein [Candidatus Aminicenantes bacterium]|jgi:farnesol dehydrogenase